MVFQALSRAKQVLPRPPKGFKAPTRDHPSPIPASIRDFSIVFLIESSPWFLPIPLFSLIPLVFIWAYKGISQAEKVSRNLDSRIFLGFFWVLFLSFSLQRISSWNPLTFFSISSTFSLQPTTRKIVRKNLEEFSLCFPPPRKTSSRSGTHF